MNVLKPHLKSTVITLIQQGISQREIHRKTGIHRKTIRYHVRAMLCAAVDRDPNSSGIGYEVEELIDIEDIDQREHLVEQGALVAIGPNQSLVDSHGQRHGEHAVPCGHEDAQRLQGVAHDVLGLLLQSDC